MSPPKVNLAEKQPPVVSEEEICIEKKEAGSLPAVVTVETEQVRYQRETFQARRRRRKICCVSLIVVVVIATAAAVLVGLKVCHRHRHHHDHDHDGYNGDRTMSPEEAESFHNMGNERHSEENHNMGSHEHNHHDHNRWNCFYGPKHLNENVWVDRHHQLIHAQHPHGDDDTRSIHVLHAYKKKFAAYKDVEKNICYITRIDETFTQGYERWESYEQSVRDPKTLKVTRKRVIVTVRIHGAHIVAHCRNARSLWAVEIDEKDVTRTMTTVTV